MSLRKTHKKDQNREQKKVSIQEGFHYGRPSDEKVKYRHKNYWLEEEKMEKIHIKKK